MREETGSMAGKYQQIKAQIAKLEAEAAAVRKVEAAEAVAAIQALIAEFDLTPEDLGFKAAGRAAKAKTGLPKYRDPQTGKTWTGRGKPPAWIAGALKSGTAEALLIQAETAPASAVAKKPSRPRKSAPAPAAAEPAVAKQRRTRAAAPRTGDRVRGRSQRLRDWGLAGKAGRTESAQIVLNVGAMPTAHRWL